MRSKLLEEAWLSRPIDQGSVSQVVVRAYLLPILPFGLLFVPVSGILWLDNCRFVLIVVAAAVGATSVIRLIEMARRFLRTIIFSLIFLQALLFATEYVLWFYFDEAKMPFPTKLGPFYLPVWLLIVAAVAVLCGWVLLGIKLIRDRRATSID